MDEHNLMELVRALVERAIGYGLPSEFADADVFRTPGDGASFGIEIEGGRYVLAVTQIEEDR